MNERDNFYEEIVKQHGDKSEQAKNYLAATAKLKDSENNIE